MDGMDVNTIANLAMILAFVALFANVLLGFFLERLVEYADRIWGATNGIWGATNENRARIDRLEQKNDHIQKLEDPWNHMKNR